MLRHISIDIVACLTTALMFSFSVSAQSVSGLQRPKTAGPAEARLIEDLVAAYRILAAEGLVDAYGHVSVRHNRDPNRYLMARSLAPALVTAKDIIELDLDSRPVEGSDGEPVNERFIHGEIYKARPDVLAVVHSHAPSAISFSISSVPLRAVFAGARFIAGGVPVYRSGQTEHASNMYILNEARGKALAASLGKNPAVLMRGHGMAVVGPSLKHAVVRAVYLEFNAKLQAQAIQLGGEVAYIEPEEPGVVVNENYQRAWDFWRERAK